MNPKRTLLILLCAALALGACAPAATALPPTATSVPASTAQAATPTPADFVIPFPAKTAVLLWHREGGIAGFCDDLSIAADGSYTVSNCLSVPVARRTGQLDAAQLRQLAGWVAAFRSFAVSDGQRVVSPDAMTVKLAFTGAGTRPAGPDDRAAISAYASVLVAQPTPGDIGNNPPAVLKARDYLARALNVSAAEIDIVSFGFVQWPDRCLGVVVVGEMCAQGVTPGYKVMLQAQGQIYELHTDETGESIRQVP